MMQVRCLPGLSFFSNLTNGRLKYLDGMCCGQVGLPADSHLVQGLMVKEQDAGDVKRSDTVCCRRR